MDEEEPGTAARISTETKGKAVEVIIRTGVVNKSHYKCLEEVVF